MPKDIPEPTGASQQRQVLDVDFCVIGAGSGGLSVAAAAAAETQPGTGAARATLAARTFDHVLSSIARLGGSLVPRFRSS